MDPVTGVRMKDVAEAAGVSVASVSNAYNRPEKLSSGVRERILATGAELGYCGPSAAGRALRHGRADAVGIVYAEQLSYAFRDPYAVTLLGAIAEVLEDSGISLNLLPVPNDAPADPPAVTYAVADGFIGICAGDTHPGVIAARRRGVPVVLTVASTTGDFVTIDEPAAGRELGAHLASLGHRDVVVVIDQEDADPAGEWVGDSGVESLVEKYQQIGWVDSAERLRGLASGLPDARMSFVTAGVNSRESAVACARLVLRDKPSATAVVAVSDLMALAVVDELRAAGREVGRDVSVAGFDGIDAALAAGLTTIGQPITEKGHRAARLLLDPDATERQVYLPSQLVVGTTTGPAPLPTI